MAADSAHPSANLAQLTELGARLTTYLGQALIALAGGYLLRASVESGVVKPLAGVWGGLCYALAWLAVSLAIARRGNRLAAAFASTLVLVLALPLVFEAAWRFELWSANRSLAVLAGVAAVSMVAARFNHLQACAWMTAIAATITAFALMVALRAYVAAGVFYLALGAITFWIARATDWRGLRWPAAIVTDVSALALAYRVLNGAGEQTLLTTTAVVLLLVAYPVFAVVRTMRAGLELGAFETAQSAALLLIAAPLMLDAAALTLLWGVLALAVTACALRSRRVLHMTYAVLFATAASAASGLLTYAARSLLAPATANQPPALAAVAVCALLGLTVGLVLGPVDRSAPIARTAAALFSAAVFLWCVAGLSSGALIAIGGAPAAVSTVVLAVVACVATAIARLSALPMARWAVFPFMFVVGLRLLIQAVRAEEPIALFGALAAYGAALMMAARRPASLQR